MELRQAWLLPIVVIIAITASANVNLSLICMGKLQIFDEGQWFEAVSPLLSSLLKLWTTSRSLKGHVDNESV